MIYFVPARRGSDRCKNKNTRKLLGVPMVQWTFAAITKARQSSPGRVVVSTDDPFVQFLAESDGFEVRSRPPELCDSKATMSDVLFHHSPELDEDVCVLYPTSPLRSARHILDAAATWQAVRAEDKTLMSVSPVRHRPHGLMSVTTEGLLACNSPLGEKFYQAQGTPDLYRANGAIYVIPASALRQRRINTQLFCPKTVPYIMPDPFGFEVDEEIDLKMAELLMSEFATGGGLP